MRTLLLIGAGQANLQVVERFKYARVDTRVILVSPHPRYQYGAMLAGTIEGRYEPAAAQLDLARFCTTHGGSWRRDRAVGLDPQARQVRLESGERLSFDLCALDVGSVCEGFELPGVAEHAVTTRPVETILDRLTATFAGTASRNVAVVGGGRTAIELACALRRRFGVTVALFEQGPRLLGNESPRAGRLAASALEEAGVDVRVGVRIDAVHAHGVRAGEREFAASFVVWATGAAAPPWLHETGLALDDHGYVRVRETLQTVTSDAVFAAGNCAALEGQDELPGSAFYGVREGEILAANLLAALQGTDLESFSPDAVALTLISTADGRAIASWGPLAVHSRLAAWWRDRTDRAWMKRFLGPAELPPH